MNSWTAVLLFLSAMGLAATTVYSNTRDTPLRIYAKKPVSCEGREYLLPYVGAFYTTEHLKVWVCE